MSVPLNFGHPIARRLNLVYDAGADGPVGREMGQPLGRLDAGTGGVATVTRGFVRAHGKCSCGWKGSEHVLSAVAVHDALVHAAVQKCQPGVPLVF